MPVIFILNLFDINEHNNRFKRKIQHGYNTKVTSYSLSLCILVSSMKRGGGFELQSKGKKEEGECESAVIV